MTTQADLLEFVEELGERFPDLSNHAVIQAAEEYANRVISVNLYLHFEVLNAYHTGAANA